MVAIRADVTAAMVITAEIATAAMVVATGGLTVDIPTIGITRATVIPTDVFTIVMVGMATMAGTTETQPAAPDLIGKPKLIGITSPGFCWFPG